jgi:hypothetical protein
MKQKLSFAATPLRGDDMKKIKGGWWWAPDPVLQYWWVCIVDPFTCTTDEASCIANCPLSSCRYPMVGCPNDFS